MEPFAVRQIGTPRGGALHAAAAGVAGDDHRGVIALVANFGREVGELGERLDALRPGAVADEDGEFDVFFRVLLEEVTQLQKEFPLTVGTAVDPGQHRHRGRRTDPEERVGSRV